MFEIELWDIFLPTSRIIRDIEFTCSRFHNDCMYQFFCTWVIEAGAVHFRFSTCYCFSKILIFSVFSVILEIIRQSCFAKTCAYRENDSF